MIARLLISPELNLRIDEINKVITLNLNKQNFKNHPDLLYFVSDSKLGIEQAKIIKEHFSLKPFQAKGRIVAFEDASNLTIEAQNALLKTIEELPTEGMLLLGAPSEYKFIPTLLSRCQVIKIQDTSDKIQVNKHNQEIEKLIAATIEERFEYIEKLKEKEEFLHSLVSYFHKNLSTNIKNKEYTKSLLQAEEWANQNVNIRAILEYLMLVMPNKF